MSISAVGPTARTSCGPRRAAPDVLSAGVTEYDRRRVGLPRERHTGGLVAVHAHHWHARSGKCVATWVSTSPGLLDARGPGLRLVLHEHIPVLGWGSEVASQV
jgi:hypothetical protein